MEANSEEEEEKYDWSGQTRRPWIQCSVLAAMAHPSGGLCWLGLDAWPDSSLRDLLDAGRWHPLACYSGLWLALMALSPWKTLRTDLTDTSIKD